MFYDKFPQPRSRQSDPNLVNGGCKRTVSITKVVSTRYCEQKAVFDHQYGDRPSASVLARRREGEQIHKRFEHAGRAIQSQPVSDSRCFIATQVYGPEAKQTTALRSWRDQVLLPSAFGRTVVRAYYAISPRLLPALRRSFWLTAAIRFILDFLLLYVTKRPPK